MTGQKGPWQLGKSLGWDSSLSLLYRQHFESYSLFPFKTTASIHVCMYCPYLHLYVRAVLFFLYGSYSSWRIAHIRKDSLEPMRQPSTAKSECTFQAISRQLMHSFRLRSREGNF